MDAGVSVMPRPSIAARPRKKSDCRHHRLRLYEPGNLNIVDFGGEIFRVEAAQP
jgi:hypothetical protein